MPVLDWINTFLPPTIRLWSFIRVQGSFNPRNLCDQRHYEYSIPTHMFLAPKPGTAMAERIKAARASSTEGDAAPAVEGAAATAIAESAVFWAAQPEETVFADDLIAKRAYRISPAVLQLTREFIEGYQGSHNYYNYTIGKDFRDRTSQRVMRKLTVSLILNLHRAASLIVRCRYRIRSLSTETSSSQ
jgi:tRNA pseudouridine38-40 synthase